MSEETKRGSNGGNARKEKLSKERRSEIAAEAAKKRWAKKKKEAPLVPKDTSDIVSLLAGRMKDKFAKMIANADAGIPAEINEPAGDIYPSYGGIDRTVPVIPEPPKENHCPACLSGSALGQGTHIAGSIEHPFTPSATQIIDTPPVLVDPMPVPIPKPPKRQPKPMPKEFKTASSYAEKRLPLAIKEKSEHVGAVAKLDAEINDLVRVIKALGGTVDPQVAMQSYPSPYGPYNPNAAFPPAPQAQYPAPQFAQPADPGIDPALFQANMGPVPGMGRQMPQVPVVPNASLGGAMDLDYTPRDEEDNKLPSMGSGWV